MSIFEDETYAESPQTFPVEGTVDDSDTGAYSSRPDVATPGDYSSEDDPADLLGGEDEEEEYDIDTEPITPQEADRLMREEGY